MIRRLENPISYNFLKPAVARALLFTKYTQSILLIRYLPAKKTGGTVQKSTRDSMVKRNSSLSSAAKKRIKKYTTKKVPSAKSS
jgi:hypothetical protein